MSDNAFAMTNRLSLDDLLSHLDKLPENKDRRKEARFYPRNAYSSVYLRLEKLNIIFSADVIDVNSTCIRVLTESGIPLDLGVRLFIYWRLSKDDLFTIKAEVQRIEHHKLITAIALSFLEVKKEDDFSHIS